MRVERNAAKPDIPNKVRTNHVVTAINFNKIPFDQVVSPDCCECMARRY